QTAEPTLVDVILATAFRLLANCILRLPFRSHEKDCLSVILGNQVCYETDCLPKHSLSLLEVNDVNAVALTENVFLHFRIPAPYLVAEVYAGLQQFFHRNRNQTESPL